MLPGIDGFEVVRVLRRELATANISIIMLTAMANVMEGLDAGADDYVLKSPTTTASCWPGPAASCAAPRPCGRCRR
jgi:CheY-like chemotaxis protein